MPRQATNTIVRNDKVEALRKHVTERRFQRMESALRSRTRYLTVVMEDIYQPHNASAVLRSCDAFGIQDVHIVENRNKYRINRGVELGTSQWLTLHRYANGTVGQPDAPRQSENTLRCVGALRKAGYRIVATSPHTDDTDPDTFDLRTGPAALWFGTELDGLTPVLLQEADEFIRIPMHGFVESLNISVSAAIALYRLSTRLRASDIPWSLGEPERDDVLLKWLRASVRHWEVIESRL